jgi:hypothetical protein
MCIYIRYCPMYFKLQSCIIYSMGESAFWVDRQPYYKIMHNSAIKSQVKFLPTVYVGNITSVGYKYYF